MVLVACICATRRDPGVEPSSNSHTAQGRQEPMPRIRNLSPSRKLSSIAATVVATRCTNRDVPEGPSPYPDAKHVSRRYGSPEWDTVDEWKQRRCNNHTEPNATRPSNLREPFLGADEPARSSPRIPAGSRCRLTSNVPSARKTLARLN